MRRFIMVLLIAMLLLTLGSLWAYHSYQNRVGSVGPVFLSSEKHGNFTQATPAYVYTPTSSLVTASCNGNGLVEVYDIITGKLVNRKDIYGHVSYQFVLPREGDYLIIDNRTGKLTCSFRFVKNYPTKEVQNVVYGSGTAFALLLAFFIWRELG